jgi:demethylmenaquinone methyltransferase/2-methoxy-6-polyprenyl-1,4-benzoquinol methylase
LPEPKTPKQSPTRQGIELTNLSGSDRVRYVQGMFARIAPRYDCMNRLMTAGQDIRWRTEVIQRARLSPGDWLLDLGAGTGDLAEQASHKCPDCHPVAVDFTLEMMRFGKRRVNKYQSEQALASISLDWSAADAIELPFPPDTFDAVVSGFLLRNVSDLNRVLAEQFRVLKPGGVIVALDTTRPEKSLFSPILGFHLHVVIPTLGQIVAGERDAYVYLPDSTVNFLSAERLAARMARVGFKSVAFCRRMLGAVAIHWGEKVKE